MNVSLTDYRGLLATYLRPQRGRVVLLALALAGSIGLQLLNPQVIRYFIDTTQLRGDAPGTARALVLAALAFIGIGLSQRALALATLYLSETVGWHATNRLRADLLRHCLRLDMSFHKRHTPGELIERLDGDVTAMANFFAQFVVKVAGNALLIVAVLLLLFREDWRAGAALSVYALATLGVLGTAQNLAVRRFEAQRQASAEQFGFLEEHISGTEDIRASGAEPYVLFRLGRLMHNLLERRLSAELLGSLTYAITNFLFAAGYGLGLAIGAYLYSRGAVTIGTAFLMVYYIGMLSEPLENIREQARDLQQAGAGIARVNRILRQQPRVRETGRASLPAGPLAVEFRDVTFRYDDAEQVENDGRDTAADGTPETVQTPGAAHDVVLDDISFRLERGAVLGLLGRTGSGKTTLTRLLFRLYDPTSGAILLDGMDLRDTTLTDLRGRVGMVTQDVQLFQASVRDNLAFFNPEIADSQIERALKELGLWEWVKTLPRGLDTQLGPGGQGLSAGEAQLLAFTRVLLKDPGLVILDEASSRLDPATERLLERAIDRLLAGRTGIIIAHRLRTVQRAGAIMILENGHIAEYGPRSSLRADPHSRFYGLLQTGLEEALA